MIENSAGNAINNHIKMNAWKLERKILALVELWITPFYRDAKKM